MRRNTEFFSGVTDLWFENDDDPFGQPNDRDMAFELVFEATSTSTSAAPVPVPAALPLLAGAVALLAARRPRRR